MSAPRKIDGRQAFAALVEVVDELGEGQVADCIYADVDSEGVAFPVCIVGHALTRLGVDPGDLLRLDAFSMDISGLANSGSDKDYLGVELLPTAVSVLRTAQEVQDGDYATEDDYRDKSWGNAVEEARRVYEQFKANDEFEEEA